MAKRSKDEDLSSDEEFSVLVGQIEQKGYKGIPKAMTTEGLEVLAFDLEERDKLARVRAWIKSQAKPKPGVPKPKLKDDEKKAVIEQAGYSGLTPEQQAMKERMAKIWQITSKDDTPSTEAKSGKRKTNHKDGS